jgi:hypothetical protein
MYRGCVAGVEQIARAKHNSGLRGEINMNDQELSRLARRETLLKLAATGALGAGGILGLVRQALAAGSLPATPGIRHAKGPVSVDNQRGGIGQVIRPGQTVSTGAGGEAIYILGSDAFLQRENTKVKFDDSTGVETVRIITGKLLSVFGKGNRQIATVTATIGIRGTGCYIEAEETRTYFCLCYGEAEVTPSADPKRKETIRTKHHEHPIIIGAQPGPAMMAPAPMVNHSDAELTMLENAVGRWPPFQDKRTGY